MAREILFKAKRLDNGEWIEGYYVKRVDTFEDFDHAIFQQKNNYMSAHGIDEKTLCQYTGLTDKNGNKIWENDIVERYYYDGDSMCISKILWANYGLNEGWCCEDIKNTSEYLRYLNKIGFGKRESKSCEVIGNIFDNPELVGEENAE